MATRGPLDPDRRAMDREPDGDGPEGRWTETGRRMDPGPNGDGPVHGDSAIVRLPTSEYRSGGNGVLQVVLGDGVYSWKFLNTKYSNIQDAGRGVCH